MEEQPHSSLPHATVSDMVGDMPCTGLLLWPDRAAGRGCCCCCLAACRQQQSLQFACSTVSAHGVHADSLSALVCPCLLVSAQAQLQRATASHMVPLRELGRGAFAAVHLASMPVAGKRKLLVCKKLLTQETIQQSSAVSQQEQLAQGQPQQQLQPQPQQRQKQPQPQSQDHHPKQQEQRQSLPPPLKASSLQDWSREVTMHRESAGCSFVLQLLAAKKCRAGNLLLLTEFAEHGSLTAVLARIRLQHEKARRAEQEHAMRRCVSASSVLQHQQQQGSDGLGPLAPESESAAEAQEPSVLCSASGVAALCDALRDSHAPTAVLIHGIDVDVEAATAAVAAAAGAGAVGRDHHHHHSEHAGLDEPSARFYTACILMGLQWLHSRRILHR